MKPVFDCRKDQTNSFYRNANENFRNGLCLPRLRMGVVSGNAISTDFLAKVQILLKEKWIS